MQPNAKPLSGYLYEQRAMWSPKLEPILDGVELSSIDDLWRVVARVREALMHVENPSYYYERNTNKRDIDVFLVSLRNLYRKGIELVGSLASSPSVEMHAVTYALDCMNEISRAFWLILARLFGEVEARNMVAKYEVEWSPDLGQVLDVDNFGGLDNDNLEIIVSKVHMLTMVTGNPMYRYDPEDVKVDAILSSLARWHSQTTNLVLQSPSPKKNYTAETVLHLEGDIKAVFAHIFGEKNAITSLIEYKFRPVAEA